MAQNDSKWLKMAQNDSKNDSKWLKMTKKMTQNDSSVTIFSGYKKLAGGPSSREKAGEVGEWPTFRT